MRIALVVGRWIPSAAAVAASVAAKAYLPFAVVAVEAYLPSAVVAVEACLPYVAAAGRNERNDPQEMEVPTAFAAAAAGPLVA